MTLRQIDSLDTAGLLDLVLLGRESDADAAYATLLGQGWSAQEIERALAARVAAQPSAECSLCGGVATPEQYAAGWPAPIAGSDALSCATCS